MAQASSGQASPQRVTPLELFFDLVVVFAITQVTTLLTRNPTWDGLLRGVLLLGVLWWAWSAYAWLTNMFDPEQGAIRLAVFAAAAAMLIVSLAAPGAFGSTGVLFGVAYFAVRAVHLVLFASASRGDRDLFPAVLRTLPSSIVAPSLLVVAGFATGSAQLGLWVAALAILYLSPLVGRMQGYRISPEHFVERYGLIMIIALGESIVAIGFGARSLNLNAGVIVAALMGITVAACLWWAYFDWVVFVTQGRLARAAGPQRALFARDAYAYLHLPMVGGIVLFAFGLNATLADVSEPPGVVPAVGLYGGVALYFLSHVALRLRIGGGLGRGRPFATILLVALLPVATQVPALIALGVVAAICILLIVYEVLGHSESRSFIRSQGGAFSMDDPSTFEELRRRDRAH